MTAWNSEAKNKMAIFNWKRSLYKRNEAISSQIALPVHPPKIRQKKHFIIKID